MKRYCYALDLVDNDKIIQEYISYHNQFWLEIQKSILDSGINLMEIYCVVNRLFMITDVDSDFSLEKRASDGRYGKSHWNNRINQFNLQFI